MTPPDAVMVFYEGMRVTLWGWSLLLASLVVQRAADLHKRRQLHPNYIPIRLPERPSLLWFAGCVCTVVLSTYTRIITDSLRGLPRSNFSFPELLVSTSAFMVVTAWLVMLLTYDRNFKVKWLAGWSVLSLVVVWTQTLW